MLPNKRFFISILIVCLFIAAGCHSGTVSEQPPAISGEGGLDERADRMHEICGAFLLFYMKNHRLPDDLQELALYDSSLQLTNTAQSEDVYLYFRDTPPAPGRSGYLLLVNTESSSSRKLWAIIAQDIRPAGPLTLQVVEIDAPLLDAPHAQGP